MLTLDMKWSNFEYEREKSSHRIKENPETYDRHLPVNFQFISFRLLVNNLDGIIKKKKTLKYEV